MYKIFGVILATFILQSCASWVKKAHEYPASDIMFIHTNPKVGDYAVYADIKSELQKYSPVTRQEIFNVSDAGITVRYKVYYLDPEINELAPKEWYYRLLDRDGKVLKAWAETGDGKIFNTPVTKSGEPGSLEHLTRIDKKFKKPVDTKAGKFEIDSILAYVYRFDAGLISTNTSCMEFHSSKVPFNRVGQECVTNASVGAFLTTMEYINEVGNSYLSGSYVNIYNKATSSDADYKTMPELIEYGFAQ